MTIVILKVEWPGLPAGTVMTMDSDGNYRDPSGVHWMSPRFVEENPNLFEEVSE